ncbi:MAG: transcription elongation factor GreAB [Acidobacteria bacterium]|nr:transcription elongation factor GreAB [Acidobacteriota bacterium]MCB9397895.1 transcription elongation factor GreAB [Acidobacteriota bacterium]
MEKQKLLDKLIEHFEAEWRHFLKSAQVHHEMATHEENVAENEYDTRGLEASYLAEGHVKQAKEAQLTLSALKRLELESFEDEPIAVGALVELANKAERRFYFLGPRGGGAKVEVDGVSVTLITPNAPLGRALSGKTVGEEIILGGHAPATYEIINVT